MENPNSLTDLEIELLRQFAADNPDRFTFGYDPDMGGYMFYMHGDLRGCAHPKWVVDVLLEDFEAKKCNI